MGLILNLCVTLLIVQVYSDTVPVQVPSQVPEIIVKKDGRNWAPEIDKRGQFDQDDHDEDKDKRGTIEERKTLESGPEQLRDENSQAEILRLVPVPGRWGVYKTPKDELVRVVEAVNSHMPQRSIPLEDYWRLMMGGQNPESELEKEHKAPHPAPPKENEGKPGQKPAVKPMVMVKPEGPKASPKPTRGIYAPGGYAPVSYVPVGYSERSDNWGPSRTESRFSYQPAVVTQKRGSTAGPREARFWPFSSWNSYDNYGYGGGYGDPYYGDDLGDDFGDDEGYGGYGGYGGGYGGYGSGYYKRRSLY